MAGTQAKDQPATRDESKLHDTRQLLNELDALMDQMLALPIDGDDTASADQAPATGTISATLTLVAPTNTPSPSDSTGTPILSERHVVAPNAPSTNDAEPALTEVAAPKPAPLMTLPEEIPTSRWRPGHISYRFLLWVNQGFDQGADRLGKPGKLLHSRTVRTMLGIAGFGLMATALLWLVRDWLAWNW